MKDLISRQAAIDAIEEMQIPIMRSIFPEEQFVFTGMSEALRAIKDLSHVQQERWISCSERLPEKNGRYLVTRGLKACNSIWNRVYIVNYSDLMGLKAEKIWWDGNVGKSDFQKIDDVIAWKPLAEPYKGEQE